MPEIGEIFVKINGRLDDLEKKLAESKQKSGKAGSDSAKEFSTKFQGAMKAASAKMTAVVTAPLLAAGVAAAKLSIEFGDAMAKVEGAAGAGRKEVENLRGSVLNLAGATGKAPKELADALYYIESKSYRGKEALDILTKSAKLSASGLGDTADVARTLGFAINAYGHANLTAARAADIFASAVREGSMPSDALAGSLGRILPEASRLGVGFDQLTGSLSAMTRIGLNVDEAVTSLRQVFLTMDHPSAQTKKALAGVGLTAEQVAKSLKTDLIGTLGVLAKAGEKSGEEFARIFPNVRAFTGVLALTGEQAGQVATLMDHVKNSTGSADQIFRVASKTVGFQMRQSFADLKTAGIELGDSLAPVIRDLSLGIKSLAEWFKSLTDEQKNSLVKWAMFAAAVGPAIKAFTAVQSAIKGIIELKTAFAAAQAANVAALAATEAQAIKTGEALTASNAAAASGAAGGLAAWAKGAVGVVAGRLVPMAVVLAGVNSMTYKGSFADGGRDAGGDSRIKNDDNLLSLYKSARGQFPNDETQQFSSFKAGLSDLGLDKKFATSYFTKALQQFSLSERQKMYESTMPNRTVNSPSVVPSISTGDAIADPTKSKKEVTELTKAILQGMAKSISTPSGEASCAYFASAMLQKTGVQVGKMGGAKALIDSLLSHGGTNIGAKDAKAGDLVYYYGKDYGAQKDSKGNGYHVGMYAGDGYVVDSSGGRVRMNNTVHAGARFIRPKRSGQYDNLGDLASMSLDAWAKVQDDLAAEQKRLIDSLEPIRKIQNARKAEKLKANGGLMYDVISMREFGKDFSSLTDEANKNKVRALGQQEAIDGRNASVRGILEKWASNNRDATAAADAKAKERGEVNGLIKSIQMELNKKNELSTLETNLIRLKDLGVKVTMRDIWAVVGLSQAIDKKTAADKAAAAQNAINKKIEEQKTEGLKQYAEAMRNLGDRTVELGRSSEVNAYRLQKFALSFAGGNAELAKSAEIMRMAKSYMMDLAKVEDMEKIRGMFDKVADSMVTPIRDALSDLVTIDFKNFFRSLNSMIGNAMRDIANSVVESGIRNVLNGWIGGLVGGMFNGSGGSTGAGATTGIIYAERSQGGTGSSARSMQSAQSNQYGGITIVINATDAQSVIASQDQVALAMRQAQMTAARKF